MELLQMHICHKIIRITTMVIDLVKMYYLY